MGNLTDELRAKLSEHGIEYEVVDRDIEQNTFWNLNGVRYKYNALVDSQHGCLSICCANFLTPEQAIAATVGAGTCRNIAELNREGLSGYFFVCSECGLAVHANLGIRETNYPRSKPDGSTDLRTFNSNGKYEFERCPRCGRKVTK